jgi:CheY-like chemotaxis protein
MPEHSVEVLQRRIAALTRTNTVLKTELKRARAERTGGSSFMRANLDKLHGALKDTQSRVETLTIEKSKIEKVQQTKDEFMASMSHELRTPLATIIGNCDLLLERAGDGDELEIIHAIQRAGHNQLALVNDILDMSKIESGKFTIDEAPFDQAGGDGFLSKPIDKAELQRTLQRHLLLQQDPQQLQLQGIADRRKAERRSEEVAIIEDERTPKGPRRLSDRVRQATSAAIVNGPVDEAVDDEVTTLFLESSSKNRDRLTIALREREWEEIEAIAHSIKGSATSFGYPDLSTLAESLQNTIAQGEHRQATAEALDLVLALSRILP